SWIAVAAALVLGALGTWVVTRLQRPATAERVYRLQIVPPEGGSFASEGDEFAASPDGRSVVYAAAVNGKTAVWVQPLDGAARRLPGTEGAISHFGPRMASSSDSSQGSRLLSADIAGGAPLVICETEPARGAAWSSDGHIIWGV